MAIEISMQEPLDSELPSSAVYGFDPSEMSTTKLGNLTDWLADQTAQRNSFLAQAAKAASQLIDGSETEPESELPAISTNRLVDDPAKCAGPVPDDSETEPESEPEAPTAPDFTIWYEANKHKSPNV